MPSKPRSFHVVQEAIVTIHEIIAHTIILRAGNLGLITNYEISVSLAPFPLWSVSDHLCCNEYFTSFGELFDAWCGKNGINLLLSTPFPVEFPVPEKRVVMFFLNATSYKGVIYWTKVINQQCSHQANLEHPLLDLVSWGNLDVYQQNLNSIHQSKSLPLWPVRQRAVCQLSPSKIVRWVKSGPFLI